MDGYLIGEDFAKRIKASIARVDGEAESLSVLNRPAGFEGGRAGAYHLLAKTNAQWNKGTSQDLKPYAGEPGAEVEQGDVTITAWNHHATLPSGIWVLLARANGTFYLVSFDYTGLPSYNAASQQVLAHSANGGLVWLNTTGCT